MEISNILKTLIIRVEEDLHKKIKVHCANKGITIQECIEKLIKESFRE